jgi:plastocyanin
MSKRWMALLLGCLVLAVVAAGCGGGSDNNGGGGSSNNSSSTTTSSTSTTTQSSAPAPSATGGGASVTMKDINFHPGTLKVKAGQTVTWTNQDSVGHDVTSKAFQSGSAGGIEPGQSFKHKFAKAGTFTYVCSVHPGMGGTVVVKK